MIREKKVSYWLMTVLVSVFLLAGMTLRAQAQEYRIVYHSNCGNAKDEKTFIQDITLEEGQSTCLTWPGRSWIRSGYLMQGWSKRQNAWTATHAVYNDIGISFFDGKDQVDVYAVWAKFPAKYGTIFIGDSYVPNSLWPGYTARQLGLASGGHCGRYLLDYDYGSGFRRKGVRGKNFMDQLLEMFGTLSNSDRKKIKKIVLCGGYNDAYSLPHPADVAPLITAMNRCLKKARQLYPNAKIYVGMIAWHASSEKQNTALKQVASIYKEVCAGYPNVVYMENVCFALEGNTSVYEHRRGFDPVHPNTDGGKILGAKIAPYLKWY